MNDVPTKRGAGLVGVCMNGVLATESLAVSRKWLLWVEHEINKQETWLIHLGNWIKQGFAERVLIGELTELMGRTKN